MQVGARGRREGRELKIIRPINAGGNEFSAETADRGGREQGYGTRGKEID